MRWLIISISLLLSNLCFSQDVMTYESFIELVKQFHPQAQLATLENDKADLTVKSARGGFDPVLSSKLKEKFFQDKSYYNLFTADVSIPTITGIEVQGGFSNNSGQFLNAQNYTPTDGTGYLGVSVPLGKGMFTDENRTRLQVAKQQKEQFEQLSKLTLNNLLFEASNVYWEWFLYFNNQRLLDSAVTIGRDRLTLVRKEFLVGDKAANDTLKAFVQYQDRLQSYYSVKRKEIKTFLMLNTFLWDDSLGLKESLQPSEEYSINTSLITDSLSDVHPSLVYYDAKIKEKEYSKRLKAEKLKPKLNLEYNLLYPGTSPVFDDFGNNQLWGLSFEYPLLARSERADFALAKIKVKEAELQFDQKQKDLFNKLKVEQQNMLILQDQLDVLRTSLSAYDKLISAERLKFRLGENSLFELNAWEQRQIENQLKYFKLFSKRNISSSKLSWIQASWD